MLVKRCALCLLDIEKFLGTMLQSVQVRADSMTMQGESSTGAHQNLAGVAEACRAHDTVSPTAVFRASFNLMEGSTDGPFCHVLMIYRQHLIALTLRTEGKEMR